MNEPSLDLHGTKHEDVEEIVENFILLHQDEMPLEIIYGNSVPMYDLVKSVLLRMGLSHTSGYKNQFGRLFVTTWQN